MARMMWLHEGDIGSEYFFNIIKHKQEREIICLISVDDVTSSDYTFMKEVFYSVFETILF